MKKTNRQRKDVAGWMFQKGEGGREERKGAIYHELKIFSRYATTCFTKICPLRLRFFF
jgi:hypothetical protein